MYTYNIDDYLEKAIFHRSGKLGLLRDLFTDNSDDEKISQQYFELYTERKLRKISRDEKLKASKELFENPDVDFGKTDFREIESVNVNLKIDNITVSNDDKNGGRLADIERNLIDIDKIAAVKTAPGDRPVQDVRMKMKMIR